MISSISSSPTWRNSPHLLPKISTSARLSLRFKNTSQGFGINRYKPQWLGIRTPHGFALSGKSLGIFVRAQDGPVGGEREMCREEEELEELRGKSTMPDRFRYLNKEAPSPPLRWPWFVALAFLIYAWRSVLWELSNWRKVFNGVFQFVQFLLKLVVAFIFHFIGDPITYTILYIERAFHAVRSFYSSIVTSAPVPELTTIILLASIVLAVGEAASPGAVNHQSFLLTAGGVIGYCAVRGVISEPVFWLMLLGLFSFARLVKKGDNVSSALPVAAVLASVGEPWVRLLSIISFTALAIHQHCENPIQGKEEAEVTPSAGKVPFPLLALSLAIGIHLAAKWAGYRHLTWMVV